MQSPDFFEGLTFDDVFIRPRRTGVIPDEVSLATEILRGFVSRLPVIPAPMNTVFSPALAAALEEWKVPAPLPREMGYDEIEKTAALKSWSPIIATTSPFRTHEVKKLLLNPAIDYLLLDTVAAHNEKVFALLDSLSSKNLNRIVIGNIATAEAARDFAKYNLAGVRVGLGPGSICTTTEITGVGMPQLQAIREVAHALEGTGTAVIADGGIKSTGDIAKALAAGASGVMMGRMFAATTEAAGSIVTIDGVDYKKYEGAEYATIEINNGHKNQELQDGVSLLYRDKAHRSEGVSGLLKHSGSVNILMEHISRCLSASLAFVGAADIPAFRERVVLQRVSALAQRQGKAHSVDVVVRKNRFMVA